MVDIDCSTKKNGADKINMMTSKQMNNILGKSKDHDPESPHLNWTQQKQKGTMTHKCKVGDKTHKQSEHCNILMGVRSGEKRYQCKVCDKCFPENGILKRHIYAYRRKTISV